MLLYKSFSSFIILTFVVTSLYDVILRYFSKYYDLLPEFIQNNFEFIKMLQGYFEKHTILGAALIAGFVGASTQLIILPLYKKKKIERKQDFILFMMITFIISALYGFGMKATGLFPHLDEYYYKPLGAIRGAYHDGISGLIVQITNIFIIIICNKFKYCIV